MRDFDIRATTDYIANWGLLELPISGPADANTLVILTGSAYIGLDVDDEALSLDVRPPLAIDLHPGDGAGDDRPFVGQLLVYTNYIIPRGARYKDVGGDGGIQQTTYATLADIQGDDEGQALVTIAAADAYLDSLEQVVVRMQVEVQGDCTLQGIAYQVHLVLHQDRPELSGKHPVPAGEVDMNVE